MIWATSSIARKVAKFTQGLGIGDREGNLHIPGLLYLLLQLHMEYYYAE